MKAEVAPPWKKSWQAPTAVVATPQQGAKHQALPQPDRKAGSLATGAAQAAAAGSSVATSSGLSTYLGIPQVHELNEAKALGAPIVCSRCRGGQQRGAHISWAPVAGQGSPSTDSDAERMGQQQLTKLGRLVHPGNVSGRMLVWISSFRVWAVWRRGLEDLSKESMAWSRDTWALGHAAAQRLGSLDRLGA